MAPFPEAEIMTIKRLEVALRKADFKLLKEGAYKLHEKFHEGFQFEHLDLLKEIYVEITDNPSIPQDTVAILAQTINDIIAKQDVVIYKKEEPSNKKMCKMKILKMILKTPEIPVILGLLKMNKIFGMRKIYKTMFHLPPRRH